MSTDAASTLATAQNLLEEGKKIVEEGKEFDAGIDKISEALAMVVSGYSELAPQTAPFYMEYGKALLRQSKAEEDVFSRLESENVKPATTADVPEETDEKEPLEEDEKEPLEDEKQNDGATEENGEMSDPVEFPVSTPQVVNESESAETNPAPAEEAEGKGDDGAESQNMSDGRELAWQLFETARVVYANGEFPNKGVLLADVHQCLGDVAVEDNNFDRGYQEYTDSIKCLGPSVELSNPLIGKLQQLAGMCALYAQQNEAAIFHYTAAAENHNMQLEEHLVKAGVMEPKPADAPETEEIEFVDEEYLAKLKEKVGEESSDFKTCSTLFAIVNDLIDRVEEIQALEDEAQLKVQEMIKKLATQLGKGQGGEVAGPTEPAPAIVEQNGFDSGTTSEPVTQVLVTRRKNPKPQATEPTVEAASTASTKPSEEEPTQKRPLTSEEGQPDAKRTKI